MKIGQVARAAGVSIDTVRFYERRGVLPPPGRRPSGHRVYTATAVHQIQFAKTLQRLGFTLTEIIAAQDADDEDLHGQQWRIDTVAARIDGRIARLTRTRHELTSAWAQCRTGQCHLVDVHNSAPSTATAGAEVIPQGISEQADSPLVESGGSTLDLTG